MTYDYSFTEGLLPGTIVAHRIDCPEARSAADRGEPVITMLACALPLRDDAPRHTCLERSDGPGGHESPDPS